MTQMLEISDREFKITIINIIKTLMEKINNMQEQMRNVRIEMAILRKNQKNKLEIKNTVTVLKNAINEPVSIPNMA